MTAPMASTAELTVLPFTQSLPFIGVGSVTILSLAHLGTYALVDLGELLDRRVHPSAVGVIGCGRREVALPLRISTVHAEERVLADLL